MTQKTTIKISQILFLSLSGLLILYLLWQNFSPAGSQTIVFDLRDNKFVSKLNPSTRINEPICNKDFCTQTMFEDPIYFDLLLARNFDLAKIELTYQSETPIDLKIGMQIKDGWNYMVKSSESTIEVGSWKTATFYFPLSAAWINRRHVNFLISAPELNDSRNEIRIKELKFDLKR